ncbi:MAG: MobA/MobL family protein [Candidatus Nitrotoga sp.]
MASYHLSIKSGTKGKAASHSAYISRVGKHGRNREDLIAMEYGNMPDWALGNPLQFWHMADAHERINGAAYREFELALPSELNTEQQRELLDSFIQKEVGNKPYQLAIHEPTASLGSVKQPHAHIMISDRIPDDIPRPPEQVFKRFNASKPELGGCKKDSGGKDRATMRSALTECRANWANLQNAALIKYGHTARVDHRSNAERGISVSPEKHLGQAGVSNMTPEEKQLVQEQRKGKK